MCVGVYCAIGREDRGGGEDIRGGGGVVIKRRLFVLTRCGGERECDVM